MPGPVQLQKAQLRQLDASFEREIEPETWTTVQFNPETLKVSFSNTVKTPEGSGQAGPAALQYVGAGSTKLSLQLWFDVNAPQIGENKVDDVRRLTQKVAYYITPKPIETRPAKRGKGPPPVPPAVRFIWGTFVFDGVLESLEETLEMFSPDGRPLRASLTLGLTQHRITRSFFERRKDKSPAQRAGTQPMAQATSGSTVQGLASLAGRGDDWQEIAAANGIEDPRNLKPGQVIDMNPREDVGRRR
jgi:Contractile injection system tube protein/LysM domain